MFKNYIKIALRNLVKHQIHSIINVLGLSIGIAISILIIILVQEELSYDKYNENWKRIYRVNQYANFDGSDFNGALTPVLLCGAIEEEIPEVEAVTRLFRGSHKLVSYGDIHYTAERFFYTDESFFRIFSIPLIRGNKATALSDAMTIVLTRSTARQYFGDADPMGKVLELDNGWKFTVTGICEDVPETSHFHFDYLASLKGIMTPYEKEGWLLDMMTTYVLLAEGVSEEAISPHFNRFIRDYVMPQVKQYMGVLANRFTSGGEYRYYLQPVTEIHLNSMDTGEFEAGTDRVYIYVFTFVALLILLIACINFMNLATAKSITRAKEVAIRKISGASRRQLILQFLAESVFFSILALSLSLVVLELLMRPFNNYSGKNLDIFYLDSWYLIPAFIMGALIIGIISGSYPAFYLSSFRVINILKGRNFEGMRNSRLRGILVFSQFTVSIILFISSMTIYQQVKFFRQTNLGFNKNNIVVVQRAYALQERKEDFKKVLLNHKRINAASVSMALPGTNIEQYPFHIEGDGVDSLIYLSPMPADFDFLSTLQMYLVKGDFFSNDDSVCYNSILINETAARKLGADDPVGMKLTGVGLMGEGMEYTIIGVVRDYHFESLHNEINPLGITLLHHKDHAQYLSLRISGEDIPGTMDYIQKVWGKFANDEPFDFYFLNQELDAQYHPDVVCSVYAVGYTGQPVCFSLCLFRDETLAGEICISYQHRSLAVFPGSHPDHNYCACNCKFPGVSLCACQSNRGSAA